MNVSIEPNSTLSPHVVTGAGDQVIFGPVVVGNQCTVGSNSVLLGETTLGDGACISANSRAVIGYPYNKRCTWAGVPAVKIVM